MKEKNIITVSERPTIENELGIYEVIDQDGLYRGRWEVVRTWTQKKAVIRYY